MSHKLVGNTVNVQTDGEIQRHLFCTFSLKCILQLFTRRLLIQNYRLLTFCVLIMSIRVQSSSFTIYQTYQTFCKEIGHIFFQFRFIKVKPDANKWKTAASCVILAVELCKLTHGIWQKLSRKLCTSVTLTIMMIRKLDGISSCLCR